MRSLRCWGQATEMGIFRREARGGGQVRPDHAAHQSDQRPSWMRNGAQVVLLDGDEDQEVVGESYYQDHLWQLAGAQPGAQRVREDIYAVLVGEDNNPYDPNAVAVWISGLKVGHLSRENAQRYRPGLLAQQAALGRPIASRASSQVAVFAATGRESSECSWSMTRRTLA
jgi:hypothetical protein